MSSTKKPLQAFLHMVCKEIRFRSVHPSIMKELSDHIEDQKYEYIAQGLDEETATVKAIEQMGDPVVVGKQLNAAHKPRTEWSILAIAASLVIVGGMVQYFLSGVTENTLYSFSRFLIYAPLGIAAFALMYFIDYRMLERYSKLAYFILFAFTVLSLLFSVKQNGSYPHVYYASLLFIPILAGIIYNLRNKGYYGIALSGIYYAGAALLCGIAHSKTSFGVLTLAFIIMMITAIVKGFFNVNKKPALVLISLSMLTLLLITLITLPHYQYERLASMINPERDPMGAGYITTVVRELVTSAKPIGNAVLEGSLGTMSIEQLLPSRMTDFLLAYIIAKLGYLPGILIIILMIALISRMFASVFKQKNSFGFLVSLSACLVITIQISLYILTNLGIILPLSLVLPFVSFGAFGFIVNMLLIGLLLSVYRRTDLVYNKSMTM